MKHFACQEFNLLAIDGEGRGVSTPTAHTFCSCAFCQRACVLHVTVISSRIDFTHTRGSSTTWNFANCVLLKNVPSHRAMSCGTPHLSITPGTSTPSLGRPTSLSSDPLLGELQPCADLRQLERGSLAERPSFTEEQGSGRNGKEDDDEEAKRGG